MGRGCEWMVLAVAVTCAGCGDSSADSPSTAARGGAGAGAGAGGSTTAGGAGSAAGVGAKANEGGGGATGGGGSSSTGPCVGAPGPAELLFAEEMAFGIHGLSVTADELEVFYVQQTLGSESIDRPAGYQKVVYRFRTSKQEPFGAAQLLVELTDVCGPNEDVNLDISDDGWTLYVSCSQVPIDLEHGPARPLRVAKREARPGRFALLAEPFGDVSPAAAVSSDELRLYTQGKQSEEPPLMLTRTSKAASFAGAAPLPGITEYVRSPDMSADELTLVGTVRDPAGRWVIGRLVRSRPSEAFSEPQIVVQGAVPEVGLGAPNLAPGCALYYVLHHPVVGYAAYRTRLQ